MGDSVGGLILIDLPQSARLVAEPDIEGVAVPASLDAARAGLGLNQMAALLVRVKVEPNAAVDWARVPKWRVRCPHCERDSYLDQKWAFTEISETARARVEILEASPDLTSHRPN